MIRNIKALGLALVAVFAMSAMAASAAQAEGPDFTAGGYTATITATRDGTTKQTFTSGPLGGKVRCNEVGGTATLSERGNALKSEGLTYSGECKALGLLPVTVHTNGCSYEFTVETTVSATTSTGSVHLACPTGGPEGIQVTIYKFGTPETVEAHENAANRSEVITIPGGQTFTGITYHNITTEDNTMHVTVEANVQEQIHAIYTGSLYEGTSTTDSYEGTFIASAEAGGKSVDTTIEDTP